MEKSKIIYRNWKIEVDKKLTKEGYSKINKSSAEGCGCSHCSNYLANRQIVFPSEIKQLFNEIGIDESKEIEISHMTKLENGLHYYWGWFQFIGKFDGKDCSIPLPNGGSTREFKEITDNFGLGFTKAISSFGFENIEDLVQVEFDCKIPWVIDKELETD